MPDSNKGGNPFSVVMLVTLLIGGVVLENQLNLQGSRPVLDSKIHHHHLDEEDVEARLWQDPFQAVDQYVKSHQKEHGHKDEQPLVRWSKFKKNLKLKSDALKKSEKILVLGVMVTSGSYFVDAEDRIRTRYAVVSGLMSSGYRSANSEYIGYLEGKGWKHVHGQLPSHYAHHHMPYRVPYEWFERVEKKPKNSNEPQVLLVWLDDRHIFHEEKGKKRPLKNIQIFFRHLVAEALKEVPAKKENFHSQSHSHPTENPPVKLKAGDYSKFRFVVIGPPNSGQLGDMVKEGADNKLQGPLQNNPSIKILSARATKDEQQILQNVLLDQLSFEIGDYTKGLRYLKARNILFMDPPSSISKKEIKGKNWEILKVSADLSYRTVGEYFKNNNVRFLRTTPTDLKLAHSLVQELKLRGITKNSPIALVSEFDTDYGRAFRQTICKAWVDTFSIVKTYDSGKEDPCGNIYYFGYLRGLDGQIPDVKSDKSEKDSKADSRLKLDLVPEDVASLRAEQVRQYDYLLRLAGEIEGIEASLPPDDEAKLPFMFQKPRFEAFGILGSDYYDKLVVLQALRKRFSHADFFTTDMDARLFHARDYKFIRNLIVASGFGLHLRDDLQNPIPPFRDTYQTSAFLATRLALGLEEDTNPLTQEHLDKWLQPRVFEIGRTRAFDLSENQVPETDMHNALQFSGDSYLSQNAEKRNTLHSQRDSLFPSYKYPSLIILIVVLILLLCLKYKKYWREIVGTVIVLGVYTICIMLLNGQSVEEPLALFEGVSIWPTDFFRLTAVVIAVVFIQFFNKRFTSSLDVMKNKYEYTKENQRLGWFPQDEKKFWCKVGWRSAVFILISFMVLLTFGLPFIPVRGDISAVVDRIILVAFIFAFGISLFYAGVKLNESIDLIKKFIPGKSIWTDKTTDAVFENLNTSTTLTLVRPLLNDLVSLRFIGLRTDVADELIYYPFGIIAIGILSRNRVFDNWDFPLTLLCIFGFGAVYILIKAFQVQRNAKQRKQQVLDRLQIQLIHFKALSMEREKELTQMLITDTEDYKEGAFLPFVEHPFFKSMLLPFSGFGGMALLEYLFLAV